MKFLLIIFWILSFSFLLSKNQPGEYEDNYYYFKDYRNYDTLSGIKFKLDGFTILFSDDLEHKNDNQYYFYAYNKNQLIGFSLVQHWDCSDSIDCFKRSKDYDLMPDSNETVSPFDGRKTIYFKWGRFKGCPMATVYFRGRVKDFQEAMQKHLFIYYKKSCYHVVVTKNNYKAGDMKLIDEIFDSMEFY